MNSDIRFMRSESEAIANHIMQHIKVALNQATRSCLACEHFNESNELCGYYNQKPPARIIAFGCDKYEDKIPF